MTSVLTADRWLMAALSTDVTLAGMVDGRFYMDLAPNNSHYPLVELSLVTGSVKRGVGTAIIWFDELWQVKAVIDQNSYEMIGAVMDRVLAVLDAASGSCSSGVVVGCTAMQSFRFHEVVHGKIYKHLGWEFRVWTQ